MRTKAAQAHPRIGDAFVLMAPDDKVQEACQVLRLDGVLLAMAMHNAILVQHKDAEPVRALLVCAAWGPQPAEMSPCQLSGHIHLDCDNFTWHENILKP